MLTEMRLMYFGLHPLKYWTGTIAGSFAAYVLMCFGLALG